VTDARLLADVQRTGEQKSGKAERGLNYIFPEGKSLVLTFAASKETFPDTRRNFLAAVASHPESTWRLVKEFWYAGEKIYEIYEVDRLIDQQQKQILDAHAL